MKRHALYEQLVARREELTPPEEAQLAAHLGVCTRCREADGVYAEQDRVLRPLGNSHPSDLRQRILAQIETQAASPHWWRTLTFPQLPNLASMFFRATAASLLLGGIIVNTPLRDTVGAEQDPMHQWSPTSCNAEGYALLNYKQILLSPSQYRGRGILWLQGALDEVQRKIANPVYYVFPPSPINTTCQANANVTDIVVALNPADGTELHAVGTTAYVIHRVSPPTFLRAVRL
jgi:hypothetical protein